MDPKFLTVSHVLRIHNRQIIRYGGSHGVRDLNLLDSAVKMPAATFGGQFLHPEIHEMASAYLFHLVMNHPFIDGNKRTATTAAIAFLKMNGYELEVTDDELVELVLSAARGECEKAELAKTLLRWMVPS